MRREAGACRDDLACRGKIEVVFFHQEANPLKGAKGRMPLVHVADGRHLAQGVQRAQAADAQHHLLADAHVVVAAVEPAGDLPILG